MGSFSQGKDMSPAGSARCPNEAKPLHRVPRTADPAPHDRSHGSKVCGANAVHEAKERRMIDPETEYLMARAKEEAAMAVEAKNPAAAAVHRGLALRYSARAVIDRKSVVEGKSWSVRVNPGGP